MSTTTTVHDLLQTPLYRRASVYEGCLFHLLDAVEFREGDGTCAVDELLETATALLDMGLELWPKEESFHLLRAFLADLEQEDEFLEDECLVLSLSNRAILADEFAARMVKNQEGLLANFLLKDSKAYALNGYQRLHFGFTQEVDHWLERVLPPSSGVQPSLQNKLKAHLADV